MSIERGDVVRVKSGGVPMTVELMSGEMFTAINPPLTAPVPVPTGSVGCLWFNGGTLMRTMLSAAVLEKVEPVKAEPPKQ